MEQDKYERMEQDKYERIEQEWREGRVRCDRFCGAPEDPKTLEDALKTLEHYREHPYWSGCSHAR